MRQITLFTIIWILSGCISSAQKKNPVPPGELNIQAMIQPVPLTAKFINDTTFGAERWLNRISIKNTTFFIPVGIAFITKFRNCEDINLGTSGSI